MTASTVVDAAASDRTTQSYQRLKALLDEAALDYAPIENTHGFRLSLQSDHSRVEPTLVAGEATVWLMAPLPIDITRLPRLDLLEEVNRINGGLPFGLVYVGGTSPTFRNTIRVSSLRDSSELLLFVLVSMKVIDDLLDSLKRLFDQ